MGISILFITSHLDTSKPEQVSLDSTIKNIIPAGTVEGELNQALI